MGTRATEGAKICILYAIAAPTGVALLLLAANDASVAQESRRARDDKVKATAASEAEERSEPSDLNLPGAVAWRSSDGERNYHREMKSEAQPPFSGQLKKSR